MFKFKECTKKSGDRAKYIAVSKKKEFQYIKLAYDLGVKFLIINFLIKVLMFIKNFQLKKILMIGYGENILFLKPL